MTKELSLKELRELVKEKEREYIEDICSIILSAKNPPGITQTGKLSCTISFKALSTSLILSPEYYMVDTQKEDIVNHLRKRDIDGVRSYLLQVANKKIPGPGKAPYHENTINVVRVALQKMDSDL